MKPNIQIAEACRQELAKRGMRHNIQHLDGLVKCTFDYLDPKVEEEGFSFTDKDLSLAVIGAAAKAALGIR